MAHKFLLKGFVVMAIFGATVQASSLVSTPVAFDPMQASYESDTVFGAKYQDDKAVSWQLRSGDKIKLSIKILSPLSYDVYNTSNQFTFELSAFDARFAKSGEIKGYDPKDNSDPTVFFKEWGYFFRSYAYALTCASTDVGTIGRRCSFPLNVQGGLNGIIGSKTGSGTIFDGAYSVNIDIDDVSLKTALANAMNSKVGMSNFDADLDINGDGKVDRADAKIIHRVILNKAKVGLFLLDYSGGHAK